MKSGVTMRVDKAQSVLDALKTIGNRDVLVGIPAEDSALDDAPFGNAGTGYINEIGSPAQYIPARRKNFTGLKTKTNYTSKRARFTFAGL